MQSDLEKLVEFDMYELGLDVKNPEDIAHYWRLQGLESQPMETEKETTN